MTVTLATALIWLTALLAVLLGFSLLTRGVLTSATAPEASTANEDGVGLLLIVAGIVLGAMAVLIHQGSRLGRILLVVIVLVLTGLNIAAIQVGLHEQDLMAEVGIALTLLALLLLILPGSSRAYFAAAEPPIPATAGDILEG